MSEVFQNIMVGADCYRGGPETHTHAIALAKRLHASLQLAYLVDLQDLRIGIPFGSPMGPGGSFLVRGGPRESELTAEGHEEVKKFNASCESVSIKHSGGVFVGSPEMLWAEKARWCDLFMILPVERDFEWLHQLFSNRFWRIAIRSRRPVLIFRKEVLPEGEMVLFYTTYAEFTRTLHWMVNLCSALVVSLTVYAVRGSSQNHVHDEECQTFLRRHRISAIFKDKTALEVLDDEVNKPDSQLGKMSLLVFGRSFARGFWFQKHRRLVEQLIRRSHHSILLCP